MSEVYDWERLTAEDEKVVENKILAYHPRSEDKLDVGLIPLRLIGILSLYAGGACLSIRTDGVWIDFSYHKCLRERHTI